MVQNNGLHPVQLDKDCSLRHAESVELTWSEEAKEDTPVVSGTVNALHVTPPVLTPERKTKLVTTLQMDKTELTLGERDLMMSLFFKYHDTFALEDSELGVTKLAQHRIDT